MLRLALSPSLDTLRTDFRRWLKAHPCPQSPSHLPLTQRLQIERLWQAQLARGNWLGMHWPIAYGGRGGTLAEEAIVQEELALATSPQLPGLFGLSMVGPVLIEHGTDAQRQRHLPAILRAEEIWCQGFSEPKAGSDLAALSTRAVPCEGGFLVSGDKVWTSLAQIADYCFLLCRVTGGASVQGPRSHEGLVYLLLPMKSPGVEVLPLRQISGDSEFNQVSLDKVFVSADNLVGSIGSGWKIAIDTLMHERVILTFARQLQSERLLRELLTHPSSKPRTTARLCERVVHACAARALAYRHLLTYSAGKKPGPEGSLDKLLWSEEFQRLAALALDSVGIEGAAGEDVQQFAHQYLYSRGRTIAAGTSEIQRNIIAQRLLGLPRPP
jgi:alkylation response protein AidB-like acyl-CoA dehydrogenase